MNKVEKVRHLLSLVEKQKQKLRQLEYHFLCEAHLWSPKLEQIVKIIDDGGVKERDLNRWEERFKNIIKLSYHKLGPYAKSGLEEIRKLNE